jgi:hypothetical protein
MTNILSLTIKAFALYNAGAPRAEQIRDYATNSSAKKIWIQKSPHEEGLIAHADAMGYVTRSSISSRIVRLCTALDYPKMR